jgi:23S rRNA pseudouridine2605 synthase
MERAQSGANAWLIVTLTEGKNREIRKVMNYLGLQVSRLIRTAYGPFELADLESGWALEVKPKILKDKLAGYFTQ